VFSLAAQDYFTKKSSSGISLQNVPSGSLVILKRE